MTWGPDPSGDEEDVATRDPRMVPNFQAELAEMHEKMREHLDIAEPPPAIILKLPGRDYANVFTWPSPWLH